MRRLLTSIAAVAVLAGAAAFAPSALARDSFAISIGAPGFAVGYANHGGYVGAYVPPPAYYAPPPVYYTPAPVYYGPPVYGAYYYGRPWRHHYYRHW